jgi:hypothetical protein
MVPIVCHRRQSIKMNIDKNDTNTTYGWLMEGATQACKQTVLGILCAHSVLLGDICTSKIILNPLLLAKSKKIDSQGEEKDGSD